MEKLLSRDEAAALLNKPTSWLRYAEARRLIPFIKVGQQIRYRESDLEAWVAAHRVPSTGGGR